MIKKISYTEITLFFVLIDSFFLPYFFLITAPYSLPFVYFWFILNVKKILNTKPFLYFSIIIILMFISTFFGYLVNPTFLVDNLIFIVKFGYIFIVWFLLFFEFKKIGFNKTKILYFLYLFVFLFAIIYYFDKNLFLSFQNFWNYKARFFAYTYDNLEGFRFSFIWEDPNNIGYMSIAISTFLLIYTKPVFIIKVFLLLSAVFIVVLTGSSGAALSMLTMIIFLFISQFSSNTNFNLRKGLFSSRLFLGLFIIISLISTIIFYDSFILLIDSSVFQSNLQRLLTNNGQSRINIWLNLLNRLEPIDFILHLFIGNGGTTLLNGVQYLTHNGHIYWIVSYGLISYLLSLKLIFYRFKLNGSFFIWFIPIFIGFTVNIMISELKLSVIIIYLIILSSQSIDLRKSDTLK